MLKIIEPRIVRQQIGDIKRLRPTNTNHKTNDGKRVFNLILVKFKSREMKVNIMKEKKQVGQCQLKWYKRWENLYKFSIACTI